MAEDEDGYCTLTDLHVNQCGCQTHRRDLADLQLQAKTTAQFDGVCGVDPDHLIVIGDAIGKVSGRGRKGQVLAAAWACVRCLRAIEARS